MEYFAAAMSRTRPPEVEDAYAPVDAPEAWPLVSLLCFAIALASKPIVRWLPPDLRPYPAVVLLPIALSVGAALCGVLFAWIGLRRRPGNTLARTGLLLNAVVLALATLAAAALVWIVRR